MDLTAADNKDEAAGLFQVRQRLAAVKLGGQNAALLRTTPNKDKISSLSQVEQQPQAVKLGGQDNAQLEDTPDKTVGTPFVTPETSPLQDNELGVELNFQQMVLPTDMTPYIIMPGETSGTDSSDVSRSSLESALCQDPLDQDYGSGGMDYSMDSSLCQDSDDENCLNRSDAFGPTDVHCSIQ